MRRSALKSKAKLALVLAGGGARAAYQVGVLKCIAERFPEASFPVITGTSAGAINAAYIAAHRKDFPTCIAGLEAAWKDLASVGAFHMDLSALASRFGGWMSALGRGGWMGMEQGAIVDTAAFRIFLERTIDLSGIAENASSGRLFAIGLSALNYITGETVTFLQGTEGLAPWQRAIRKGVIEPITVDHIMASSAVPLAFPAVRLGEDYYGDGSIRMTAPLSPAIHLGADRMLVIVVRYLKRPDEVREKLKDRSLPPALILGQLFNALFNDNVDADAERMRQVSTLLKKIPSGVKRPRRLRTKKLLVLRPSEDIGAMAAGYASELPASLRMLAAALGASRGGSSDFLSYMMFVEPYLDRLMELGYRDCRRQWPRVVKVVDSSASSGESDDAWDSEDEDPYGDVGGEG